MMIRSALVVLLAILSSSAYLMCQKNQVKSLPNETKGACSPIAPYNQGSITIKCNGFTEQQDKILLNLLRQLSMARSKDQDALISKLDQILDTLHRRQQDNPRAISEEAQNRIFNANWGRCSTENVKIIAPHGDVEAQNFARQIRDIFQHVGMNAVVDFALLPKNENDPDLRTITNNQNFCGVDYVRKVLGETFSIRRELATPPPQLKTPEEIRNFEWDPSLPVLIFVYPKHAM